LPAKDRDINRRNIRFKEFSTELIGTTLAEVKRKDFKAGHKKNSNMIEELYLAKQQLGEKGSHEEIYD